VGDEKYPSSGGLGVSAWSQVPYPGGLHAGRTGAAFVYAKKSVAGPSCDVPSGESS